MRGARRAASSVHGSFFLCMLGHRCRPRTRITRGASSAADGDAAAAAQGNPGPVGPQGPAGPVGPSLNQLCARIGGLVYKGVCFKRAKLSGNSDSLPPDCNVYNPRASWQESDYVALMRMFKDRPTWEQVPSAPQPRAASVSGYGVHDAAAPGAPGGPRAGDRRDVARGGTAGWPSGPGGFTGPG